MFSDQLLHNWCFVAEDCSWVHCQLTNGNAEVRQTWERLKAHCKFFFLLYWSYCFSDFRSGLVTRIVAETAARWAFESCKLAFHNASLEVNCTSSGCSPQPRAAALHPHSVCPGGNAQPGGVPLDTPTPHQAVAFFSHFSHLEHCLLTVCRAGEVGDQLVVFMEILAASPAFQKNNIKCDWACTSCSSHIYKAGGELNIS